MSFLGDIKWAPFRPFDDFITSSARFKGMKWNNKNTSTYFTPRLPFLKAPDYSNLERWNNRVVQNFLYYQTNYFVITAVTYALFIFINPPKTMLGLSVLVAIIWILYQYTPNLPNRQENDKKLGIVCIVIVTCFIGLVAFSAIT